jgi:hypothetical protein
VIGVAVLVAALTAVSATNVPPAPLASPSETPVTPGKPLRSAYTEALYATINEVVGRAGIGATKVACHITLRQLPGGMVDEVAFGECTLTEVDRGTLRHALEAMTLPYTGFEPVFERSVAFFYCRECSTEQPQDQDAERERRQALVRELERLRAERARLHAQVEAEEARLEKLKHPLPEQPAKDSDIH